jgi:hypothetical protein
MFPTVFSCFWTRKIFHFLNLGGLGVNDIFQNNMSDQKIFHDSKNNMFLGSNGITN